jgi:hypothetical protein
MVCTFNGPDKTITIDSLVSVVSVKNDIYSEWKEWIRLSDNSKYLPAMRAIGGDPIGGGKFAGDMYFLQNGWTIIVDHVITVNGILYHDDNIEPFTLVAGGAVRSIVSNLAQSVSSSGYTQENIELALQPLLLEISKSIKKIEETQAFVLASG